LIEDPRNPRRIFNGTDDLQATAMWMSCAEFTVITAVIPVLFRWVLMLFMLFFAAGIALGFQHLQRTDQALASSII